MNRERRGKKDRHSWREQKNKNKTAPLRGSLCRQTVQANKKESEYLEAVEEEEEDVETDNKERIICRRLRALNRKHRRRLQPPVLGDFISTTISVN